MRVSAVIVCLSLLFVSFITIAAQPQQPDHPDLAPMQQPPPVTLTFRGRHDLQAGRLIGQLELAWVHTADVPSDTVFLRRPGPDFQQDSILFRGAPFDYRAKAPDSSVLAILLPRQLRPGERGFILLAYSVDAPVLAGQSSLTIMDNWLPAVLEGGSPVGRVCEWDVLPSRIYAEIAVDSSLRLYTGAVLLNEKEMFGLQPTADGVYQDITTDMKAADLSPYHPEFENGLRKYLFQVERGDDCAIVLGPPTRIDRVIHDSLTVDIAFPPGRSPLDAALATEHLARMVEAVHDRLGRPMQKRLLITHVGSAFSSVSTALVTVDMDEARLERLAADGILALSRWWQPDIEAIEARWLMLYTAQHATFALYGEEALRSQRAMYQPKVWPKYRRGVKPDCLDSTWIEKWEAWFVEGPKRLHTINQLVGDSLFWDRMQADLSGMEIDHADDSLPISPWLDTIDTYWMADTFATDYKLLAAEAKRTAEGGWVAEITIANERSLSLPVDISVFSVSGDSVMAVAEPTGEGSFSFRSPVLEEQPFWIFLDPYHKLPEWDRDNNQWRLTVPRRPNLTLPSGDPGLGDVLFERP